MQEQNSMTSGCPDLFSVVGGMVGEDSLTNEGTRRSTGCPGMFYIQRKVREPCSGLIGHLEYSQDFDLLKPQN